MNCKKADYVESSYSETGAETSHSGTWDDDEDRDHVDLEALIMTAKVRRRRSSVSANQALERSTFTSRRLALFVLSVLFSVASFGKLFLLQRKRPAGEGSSPLLRPLGPLARLQAANYRNKTGLMINLHISHHGGTTFCNEVGHAPNASGRTPFFACWIAQAARANYPDHNPWHRDETASNTAIVRQYFHMISWEYMYPPAIPIAETHWEDPNIFSVIVMRDPMKRLMAKDKLVSHGYPGVIQGTANRTVLEAFAKNDNFTDNFALRILAGNDCCQGKDTDRKHLEAAKELVKRFSVVIDIECLDESLQALAGNEWNLELQRMKPVKKQTSPRERIGDDEIYNYLLEKNKLDIELYEWSKSLSYLDCSQVVRDQDSP